MSEQQLQAGCYHCGLPVPPQTDFQLLIDEQQRRFCCPGCQAVATAIVSGGLENFYRFRTDNSVRPNSRAADFSAFDLPEIQAQLVHRDATGAAQVALLLEGINCAACVWLIEHHLGALPGVLSVRVNASTHRCQLRWQPQQITLGELLAALAGIGYNPVPATEGRQQALREKENRQALMRLAVAGFGMMQVGMVAVALYAGADEGWEVFLRWLSLLIATPVVLYSARPFFQAARRGLRTRHLNMDVPVSIAIGGAYSASVWATLFGGGEVYFDSVSMFTFFLLLGRYLEMRVRHRNGIETDRFAQLLPLTARRRAASGAWETVSLRQLRCGDRVEVASGACIPCDGVVRDGSGGVVETLLSGEPDAVHKEPGDEVIAGSMNTDSVLQIDVTAVGVDTRLSAIERLVEQAQQEKPSQVAMADRLASRFVGLVLLVALLVAVSWWFIDPARAFWITLSVLVVTCPCALSLASPTALTVAIAWLRQQGLLVTRGHVLEGLNAIDRVVFDKTGTLTEGCPQVEDVLDGSGQPLAAARRLEVLQICAALEAGSSHPLARAFSGFEGARQALNLKQVTGQGVQGEMVAPGIGAGSHGGVYRLGKPAFVGLAATPPVGSGQWLLLGCSGAAAGGGASGAESRGESRIVAWIRLRDSLRPSARALIADLQARGLQTELLSGDDEPEVQRIARLLGFQRWQSNRSPQQKLAYVQEVQQRGERVLMVGDGINDVPVLSAAFVSVAMGGATDLAQTRADSVLLRSDLGVLSRALDCAHLTRRIIRQNLAWALTYNLLAVPLAAAGWVPPWAAAIGMSSSSLVVVANALRIGRR
ncbi:MAG: heavy metal translocating P-type ATPase [Gammaproteobacteria bacterium]|nr:heavy metal translocating P-type ATPase [Gammaproteobacteria bacterium]